MSNDLEFAIKQDVRNNPVIREVDLDQKREFVRMLGWAGLAVVILMFALLPRTNASVISRHVEDLRTKLASEQQWQRQYQLELDRLTRPQELHRRAVEELKMIDPPDAAILPLELVPSHAPASRAIVASNR